MASRLYLIEKDKPATLLIDRIDLAESFWDRARGLLGRKHLDENNGLWIKPCNNIHTFFMKFTIDCVFVDRTMHVVKVVDHVRPFKIVGPFWKAHSVLELTAGTAKKKNIKAGDQLYVVT